MGMTYEELSVFGRLRKVEKCGAVRHVHKARAGVGIADHPPFRLVFLLLTPGIFS